jgi:hypothetical protein
MADIFPAGVDAMCGFELGSERRKIRPAASAAVTTRVERALRSGGLGYATADGSDRALWPLRAI